MAAKKKSDSSDENKKTPRNTPKSRKKAPAKKPAVKKEELPKEPIVTDDDFGLDDIDLDLADEPVLEEAKDETPEAVIVPDPTPEPEPEPTPEPEPAPVPVVEPKVEKKDPVKQQQEQDKKNRGIIWIIIIILLLAAAAVYFLVIKPGQKAEDTEPVKQEQPVQQQPDPEPEPVAQPDPEPEPPKEAQVITISEQGSRFYVVVGSFFDVDGAEDKAKGIAASGTDAYVIEPLAGTQFYRVGINPTGSFSEANGSLEGLKSTYGEEIWVLKH